MKLLRLIARCVSLFLILGFLSSCGAVRAGSAVNKASKVSRVSKAGGSLGATVVGSSHLTKVAGSKRYDIEGGSRSRWSWAMFDSGFNALGAFLDGESFVNWLDQEVEPGTYYHGHSAPMPVREAFMNAMGSGKPISAAHHHSRQGYWTQVFEYDQESFVGVYELESQSVALVQLGK